MTLYIGQNTLTASIAFNTPNLTGSYDLVLTSQWGKEVITWTLTLTESNDRYTEFTLSFTNDQRKGHLNGIYNYSLQQNGAAVEEGLMKLVVEEGGSFGTEEYISNNEDREAVVYYRPQY